MRLSNARMRPAVRTARGVRARDATRETQRNRCRITAGMVGDKETKPAAQDIIDGCREMADVYLEIEREYHPLEEEVDRALDVESPARRHRARCASIRSKGLSRPASDRRR